MDEPPRVLQGPGCKPRVLKGVAHYHEKLHQKHERGVGRRYEQRRLVHGGGGRRSGRQQFASGEEVGSWLKKRRSFTMKGYVWGGGNKEEVK